MYLKKFVSFISDTEIISAFDKKNAYQFGAKEIIHCIQIEIKELSHTCHHIKRYRLQQPHHLDVFTCKKMQFVYFWSF